MTCVLHLMKKYKNRIIATLIALAVIISGANWVMRIAVGVQRTTAHVASRASKASRAKKSSHTSDESHSFLRQARNSGLYDKNTNNLVMQAVVRIDSLTNKHALTSSGFSLNQEKTDELNQKIAAIESTSNNVSFVVVDLASGKTLGYKQSTANYTASSMKGPVIMADFEQGVLNPAATDVATAQLVQNAIVNSDNNSYQQLIDSYGVGALHNWTAGVNINTELGRTKYWWIPVADLAKMWVLGYDYLFATDAMRAQPATNAEAFYNAALTDSSRQWFADYYTHTLNSFINQGVGGTTYTKAGWNDINEYVLAQNDAGIVKSDTGDYVMAVMSTAYGRYDLLSDLAHSLASVHDEQMTAKTVVK